MAPRSTAASSAKDAAAAVVDRHLDELVALSHSVHATPELCFGETASAHAVAEALRAGGLAVDEGVYDLPTALESRAGDGELVVAVCAEYDALPDVGHACGHNIIAATAVGAGLALAAVADELGLTRPRARHAGRGGRRRQGADARAGRLRRRPRRHDGAPLADGAAHGELPGRRALRRPLHAGARRTRRPRPWEGVNAQDALTIAQVAIGLLRQQLPPGDQVHGVVTQSSAAANIIPAAVTARYMVRSRTADGPGCAAAPGRRLLRGGRARHRVLRRATRSWRPVYSHMEADPALLQAYRANAEALGPALRRRRRRCAAAHVLDGHGQRLARRAHHPPAHRH